jgi:hypothetical protein
LGRGYITSPGCFYEIRVLLIRRERKRVLTRQATVSSASRNRLVGGGEVRWQI